MKQGLVMEDGKLRYYKDDKPYHAGIVEDDGGIYYISSDGWAVKGEHIVHSVMCNGIVRKGTYTFGEDYKLIPDSYHPPKKQKGKKIRRSPKPRKGLKHPVQFWTGIALVVTVLLALVILVQSFQETEHPIEGTEPTEQNQQQIDKHIVLPEFNEEILLCSKEAKQVYDGEMDVEASYVSGNPYRPFVFEYQLADVSGILRISEDSAFSKCRIFELDESKRSLTIHNLKTGMTYYYQVTVGDQTYSGTFQTAASNRFISIPGVTNLRDIGGYQTLDGKTVKQGMVIRGVEMDGIMNVEYCVPIDAIPDVQDTFGFVYDMDLREPSIIAGDYQSRFGKEVGHKFYAAPGYAQIFKPYYLNSVRQLFADFADPEKYPMYLHCTWGADRTGTIVFLLQGLLNVSQEDALREYRLTGYVAPNLISKDLMDALLWGLEVYEGDTLQEKIISYLTTTVGVTEEEIASIQSILLE